MKHGEPVTREEINRAMMEFIEKGGRVHTLPDQRVICQNYAVPKENYTPYEQIIDSPIMLNRR